VGGRPFQPLAPLALLGLALFVAIGGAVVMLLWNWLMPALFGLPQVGFWQALGLLALSRILFGGFGGRGFGRSRSRIRRRIRRRMKERFAHMTPEERERFRQRVRERWGSAADTAGGTEA